MNQTQTATANGNVQSNVRLIGKPVIEKPKPLSLMAKAEEKIELSKSTIWLVGVIFAILGFVVSAAPQFLGWIRADESKEQQIKILQKDVDTMKDDVKEIRKSMTEIEKENSKKNGYELGVTDAHSAPKDKK